MAFRGQVSERDKYPTLSVAEHVQLSVGNNAGQYETADTVLSHLPRHLILTIHRFGRDKLQFLPLKV